MTEKNENKPNFNLRTGLFLLQSFRHGLAGPQEIKHFHSKSSCRFILNMFRCGNLELLEYSEKVLSAHVT